MNSLTRLNSQEEIALRRLAHGAAVDSHVAERLEGLALIQRTKTATPSTHPYQAAAIMRAMNAEGKPIRLISSLMTTACQAGVGAMVYAERSNRFVR